MACTDRFVRLHVVALYQPIVEHNADACGSKSRERASKRLGKVRVHLERQPRYAMFDYRCLLSAGFIDKDVTQSGREKERGQYSLLTREVERRRIGFRIIREHRVAQNKGRRGQSNY